MICNIPIPIIRDEIDAICMHPLEMRFRHFGLPFLIPSQHRLTFREWLDLRPWKGPTGARPILPAREIINANLVWLFRRMNCGSRSEEHTSELQSLMRISYAVFCLKKKKHTKE